MLNIVLNRAIMYVFTMFHLLEISIADPDPAARSELFGWIQNWDRHMDPDPIMGWEIKLSYKIVINLDPDLDLDPH